MDKLQLEMEMKRKHISIQKMCEILGMSRSAFYRKCNGKSEFTLSEIQAIIKALELEEPMQIFFANEVS